MSGNFRRIRNYRTFIGKEIGIGCDQDGKCCSHFGGDGPRVSDKERPRIVMELKNLGLEDFANYVLGHDSLPSTAGLPLTRSCVLLNEDSSCSIHYNKPEVCREYPLMIKEAGGSVVLDADTDCRSLKTDRLNDALKQKFEGKFGKPLEINFNSSIEGRAHRYGLS